MRAVGREKRGRRNAISFLKPGPVRSLVSAGFSKRSVDDLINTLELIARKDVRPLAEAMAHDSPAFNIVVWAIGHSNSQQAKRIINSLHDHQDPGVRAVVAYHEARRLRRRPRPASKTTKKTVAKKKPTKKTARRTKARP